MRRVLLDSKEAQQVWKVEWKSVSMKHGAPSVTIDGLSMMPMLFASNWDTSNLVMLTLHNVIIIVVHLSSDLLFIGSVAYSNARFGQGTGPIALNNLGCTGGEASVLDCPSDGLFNVGSCTHADDVGVECQEECETGDIRLRGGMTRYEGRVEICIDRVWGTVCDDFWGTVDAAVACRQLGYSEHSKIFHHVHNQRCECTMFHFYRCFCSAVCCLWPRHWTYPS